MRRENNENNGDTLIFNAPLTENLADIISGNLGTAYNGTSVTTVVTYTPDGVSLNGHTMVKFDCPQYILDLTYDKPFSVLFDHKATATASGFHMCVVNTASFTGYNQERGFLATVNNNTAYLYACIKKSGTSVVNGINIPNSATKNIQYRNSGFTYDGDGTICGVCNGAITGQIHFTQDRFPSFSELPLCIGGVLNYSSDRWIGIIGNVRIWSKALTSQEISNL